MNFVLRKNRPCLLCASIFLIIGQFKLVESVKCVKRLDGACKVFNVTTEFTGIKLNEFSSPPPKGFLLKTSLEINYKDNLHNYENRLTEESGKRIAYSNRLDVVTVVIPLRGLDWFSNPEIAIDLGLKNDRMARLSYVDEEYGVDIQKWSTFTPLLPRFPYHLRLEITESLEFSVYADGNDEPFFTFQIESLPKINPKFYPRYHKIQLFHEGCAIPSISTPPPPPRYSRKRFVQGLFGNGCAKFLIYGIGVLSRYGQDELVAFADCSSLFTDQYCGTHHVENVYNCRRSFDGGSSYLRVADNNHKRLGERGLPTVDDGNIVFNDTFVLDVKKEYSVQLYFDGHQSVRIDFHPDSISALLLTGWKRTIVKTVKTRTLYELPISLYAVRVQISNGIDNNYLNISNMRGDVILPLKLCRNSMVYEIGFTNPVPNFKQKIYFDCEQTSNSTYIQPPVGVYPGEVVEFTNYNKTGFNFTKTLIDTRNFVDEDTPSISYEDAFGHISTEDWCEGERLPQLYVPKIGKNDTEKIVQQILAELKSYNNRTAAAFKAFVLELQSIALGIDKLHGCRESLAQNYGWLVLGLPVAESNKQIVFDEFLVLDLEALPRIHFNCDSSHSIMIEFNREGVVAIFKRDADTVFKIAETSKWNRASTSSFAAHLEVFSVAASNYLKISNIRGNLILQVKICWNLPLRNLVLTSSPSISKIQPIYFDCMNPHEHDIMEERPRKFVEERYGIIYKEDGYNFTERVQDLRRYGDFKIQQPPVLYKDRNGHISTEDWCEGEPLPKLYEPKVSEEEYNGKINKEILAELKSLKEIVSELRSIKATIDTRNAVNVSNVTN